VTGTGWAAASFGAMGTEVHVLGDTGPRFADARAAVERRFAEDERRCSRFRDDSELSRVNRRSGAWTPISEELRSVVAFALDAARRTDGRVTPTVLRALEAAGYDRDLDEVLVAARAALHPPTPCPRAADVRLRGRRILLPEGVGLDLGGFAKGSTVDRAASEALEAGARWIVVNAGGDLRVLGEAPTISVGIDDPGAPGGKILELRLSRGALATSSVARRAWGPAAHHLIDPRTGAPASTDVVQATVWAPSCADAEVLAKDVLLRGTDAAHEIGAVVVATDGRVLVSFDRTIPSGQGKIAA
jgi:thiamine biosynthesis lipoprotein